MAVVVLILVIVFNFVFVCAAQVWAVFVAWLNQERCRTSTFSSFSLSSPFASASSAGAAQDPPTPPHPDLAPDLAPPAPPLATPLALLRPCVLVAHHAPFDVGLLSREVRRANENAGAFGAQPGALPALRAAGFASSVDTVCALRPACRERLPKRKRFFLFA